MPEVKISFDAAADYERFAGGWSRALGKKFLDWLPAPSSAKWLDVGCGTGALSELIFNRCAPSCLIGVDPSPEQIAYAKTILPTANFQLGDAMNLLFPSESFDVVASALLFHFLPDRRQAFAEMKRVLRGDGQIAGYTWKRTSEDDFSAYAPMLRGVEAVGGEALRSAIVPEGTPAGMEESLLAAGFIDVLTTELEVTQTFTSFDEYWEIQTLAFSPPGKSVAMLDQAQRTRLREIMRNQLVPGQDGTITYSACAIAGKGRKQRIDADF